MWGPYYGYVQLEILKVKSKTQINPPTKSVSSNQSS